jgi:tetratricopeptide (TPR) repeat protein
MLSDAPVSTEIMDHEKVEKAMEQIADGNIARAKELLLEVVKNVPDEYVRAFEYESALYVKFLTTDEFLHFAEWEKDHGRERKVHWIPCVYPRALWRLGFICVEEKNYDRAIEFLEAARRLDPEQPSFTIELAIAYSQKDDHTTALTLYRSIPELGPRVTAKLKAMALRGVGAQLTELGRLDAAEEAYRESRQYEDSPLAAAELGYISNLRSGMDAGPINLTPRDQDRWTCERCGRSFSSGHVTRRDGALVYVCPRCAKTFMKKWWQFWRKEVPALRRIEVAEDRNDTALH